MGQQQADLAFAARHWRWSSSPLALQADDTQESTVSLNVELLARLRKAPGSRVETTEPGSRES